jgi:hypothetical protein
VVKNKIQSGLLVVLLALSSLAIGTSANASELSTNGGSISWDTTKFFYPSGCSSFNFSYSIASSVNFANIKILNKFGDVVGSKGIYGSGTTGSTSMQICNTGVSPKLAPFEITLRVAQKISTGDGSESVVSAPLTFLSRNSSPAPIATTPPANTQPQNSNVNTGTALCVSKKTLNVKLAPATLVCPRGTVLRALR